MNSRSRPPSPPSPRPARTRDFASGDFPRVEWVRLEETIERGVVVVTISRQPIRYPRYAIEIGVRLSPDKVGRFFNVRITNTKGVIGIERIDKAALVAAVTEAEDLIFAMAIEDAEASRR